MDNNPLSFFTSEEIVAELSERFGNILLVTEHENEDESENMQVYTIGGIVSLLGMAQYASMVLVRKAAGEITFDKCSNNPDDEEEE